MLDRPPGLSLNRDWLIGFAPFVSTVTEMSLSPATQVELSITLAHSQPDAGLTATNQNSSPQLPSYQLSSSNDHEI